jgi:hypothetical protein
MASDIVVSEKLEDPLQGQSVVEGGSVCSTADTKTQDADRIEAGLICKSFRWITSQSSSAAGTHHGGRASMAYLQGHPNDDSVHVVMV